MLGFGISVIESSVCAIIVLESYNIIGTNQSSLSENTLKFYHMPLF
jgi:hypothetical protein